MKCEICGSVKNWTVLSSYDEPDKYEQWLHITDVSRSWFKCKCGFIQQLRNYPLWQIEHIYKEGYRNPDFRGESIRDAFDRLSKIKDSENERRFIWFGINRRYADCETVLDIGSGIGVWPSLLKNAEYSVTCVEENRYSINFIIHELGIPCFKGLHEVQKEFDTVTLIHVLEHIEKPDDFLQEVKKRIRKNGTLFIEVPDAVEFEYLPFDHDEFNSCHVAFYNIETLNTLLTRNGFQVTDMHRLQYKSRNLSRIMCLATNQ